MKSSRLLSLYHPSYPEKLVYMFQMVGYSPNEFWYWWRRATDFRKVDLRRQVEWTRAAKALMVVTLMLLFFILGISLGFTLLGLSSVNIWYQIAGITILFCYPILLVLFLFCVVWIGDKLVVKPRQNKRIAASKKIFKDHPGTVIVVAGSYGKTTMKEILNTVLSEGGKTAATPGNKNVAISHARFAESLDGDEMFVIIELGEGYRGDVAKFCQNIDPDIALITGLAPNHLDQYGTLEVLRQDLLSATNYVGEENAYICGDNAALKGEPANYYDEHGALGWKVEKVNNSIEGLNFSIKRHGKTMRIRSRLVGRHLIGSLTMAAALAEKLGLSSGEIETGLANTVPFEHRLEPRNLHGSWIIDDTYNGSIEGMRAGLALLKELRAERRKVYVTPGLVDQGEETEKVHAELGKLIAETAPDLVVLMKNSVTDTIVEGLQQSGYNGEVKIVYDPLDYYQNLDVTVAAGDIVMLQNDWTDNYA